MYQNKFVDFYRYCNCCVYGCVPEECEPCRECLQTMNAVNLYSVIPIKFKSKHECCGCKPKKPDIKMHRDSGWKRRY